MDITKITERKHTHPVADFAKILAICAAQGILLTNTRCIPLPVKIASSALLFYMGLTGKLPFITLLRRLNENHGQLNCKVEAIIRQRPDRVFAYLRDFTNLTKHFSWVKSVSPLNGTYSGWHVEADLLGVTAKWDFFIVKERDNEFLGWSTANDTVFYNSGKFEVHPGRSPEETRLEFVFSYTPPAGKFGKSVIQPFHALVEDYVAGYIQEVGRLLENGHDEVTDMVE
ncbi:SRPBCC family protein [Sphingobacterium sp. LRF_L2]|uniref:SRPBCC family protein n=1 Tax=Sphingobacterium sp. LRF_L2 TaxID=3369421 RepID=UPI003F5FF9AB